MTNKKTQQDIIKKLETLLRELNKQLDKLKEEKKNIDFHIIDIENTIYNLNLEEARRRGNKLVFKIDALNDMTDNLSDEIRIRKAGNTPLPRR